MKLRLTLNIQSSSLCSPCAWITSMCHHSWIEITFEISYYDILSQSCNDSHSMALHLFVSSEWRIFATSRTQWLQKQSLIKSYNLHSFEKVKMSDVGFCVRTPDSQQSALFGKVAEPSGSETSLEEVSHRGQVSSLYSHTYFLLPTRKGRELPLSHEI